MRVIFSRSCWWLLWGNDRNGAFYNFIVSIIFCTSQRTNWIRLNFKKSNFKMMKPDTKETFSAIFRLFRFKWSSILLCQKCVPKWSSSLIEIQCLIVCRGWAIKFKSIFVWHPLLPGRIQLSHKSQQWKVIWRIKGNLFSSCCNLIANSFVLCSFVSTVQDNRN